MKFFERKAANSGCDFPVEEIYKEEVCKMLDEYNVTYGVSDKYTLPACGDFYIVRIFSMDNQVLMVKHIVNEKLKELREKKNKK